MNDTAVQDSSEDRQTVGPQTPDAEVLRRASGMADHLGDESWKQWDQGVAEEVASVLDELRRRLGRNVSQFLQPTIYAHDPLTCACCQAAAGGLAAGRRAARTVKDLTQELLRVERALCEDDESPGAAAERVAAALVDCSESEQCLLEAVRDAQREMADQ